MWKLTIEDDEGKQTTLPLAHDEYGVGRAESNNLRLTDRNISRNHAVLGKNGQGWFLRDLSSYNGTYVNGGRVVGEQPLRSGDVIQLGDYRIELLDEGLVVPVAPGAAPAPAVPPVHQRPNRLVVVVGPQPGTEYALDKEHFTIGRSEDATISINHSSVSRVHSELFALGNGRFEIVDKASANGIRINGVELKRGILEAGDALELGDVRLRFVGAGKIFRADMTQNLPAVAGFDMSRSVPAGGARSNASKIIAIASALAAMVVLAIAAVAMSGGNNSSTAPKKTVVTKEQAKQVNDALKLLDGKDYDGAHKALLSIPEDARPVDDDNFKKVEAAWADWKFQQVNDAPDSTGKKTILKQIAGTDTLDAKARTRALSMIGEIEAKEPPPVDTSIPRMTGTFVPGSGTGAPAKTVETTVVAPPPAAGPPNEDAIRRSLERKANPSVDDLRMLKAICSHQGDKQCRNRASEMLKKKLEGN
jgi:pSer/pThr/pTyr-binding forkhead associated (FHA) protein